MADSSLAIKAFAIIMAIAFISSALMLIDTNNKYLDLTESFNAQNTEIAQLQSKLNQTQTSLQNLNATLTTLEKNPLVKASMMIIDVVGLDYFNKYFHDPTIYPDVNFTRVEYKYRIEVGEYTADERVTFYVYHNQPHVFKYGAPVEGNLQPFNVTKGEAVQLAVSSGLPPSDYPLETKIYWDSNTDAGQLPSAAKYVWEIRSWSGPPWARNRNFVYALVDPVTGEVYTTSGRGGNSYVESQIDTPEEAAALGIDGYVKLDYPDLPDQIQIVRGGNFTFTLTATFTSYNPNKPYVKLYVDPQYRDPYRIQSNMADILRGLFSYEPEGSLTLRDGETVNITATIRFPNDEVGQVFLFHHWALDGLGIGTDDILVLSDIGA